MEESIYYGEIAVSSLHTSICNNGGYTKHIHKRTTNKTVPVSIVSIVCSKNSRRKMVQIRMEEEIYYGEIANHHYLPQHVIMVDIGIRFRNIQGLKWYRF